MDTSTITCPRCQASFPLTSAIAQPIADKIAAELEAEYQRKIAIHSAEAAKRSRDVEDRERAVAAQSEELRRQRAHADAELASRLADATKALKSELEKKAQEDAAAEIQDLRNAIESKSQALMKSQALELELRKEKQRLDEDRAGFELEKQRALDAERQRILVEATEAAKELMSGEVRTLQAQLDAKSQRLVEAERQELALRKDRAELEEQKRALDVEFARRTDEVRAEIGKLKDEEFRLKEAESARKLADMTRQIDELKRKAEQGSQQAQGETLEVELEKRLHGAFPRDQIQPVPKGVQGADLIQQVYDDLSASCGSIVWESKRTKAWSDSWIEKLKDDQRAVKAHVAVIVSTALPKDVDSFDCRDGVWIVSPTLALPLASVLRMSLIDAASVRRAAEGRHDKMEEVYDYLAGPEFKSRVRAIAETFITMKAELDAEKAAITKLWAKRAKQIERIVTSTTGLHGDLQAIIGRSLPMIDVLELGSIADAPANAPADAQKGGGDQDS